MYILGSVLHLLVKSSDTHLVFMYLVHPEKWLPAILSSVANKILNVNTLIYLYFIGSHDAFASWRHFHVPLLDQKNASRPVFLVEILREFEENAPFLKHIMRFSGPTIYTGIHFRILL